MKTTQKMLTGIATLILTAAQLQAVNLVVNGSFENGSGSTIPGWTVTVGSHGNSPGIYTSGQFAGANVTDGNKALDFGVAGFGNGNSISQSIGTVVGQEYVFSFDWGSEYGWGTQSQLLIAGIEAPISLSEDARSAYPNTRNDVEWIKHHYESTFIASSTLTSLTFSELAAANPGFNFGGLVLDNIRVEAVSTTVPDGGNMAMMLGGGLVCLVAAGRRKPTPLNESKDQALLS